MMISSLTRFISTSSLSMSTLTVFPVLCTFLGWSCAAWAPASSASNTSGPPAFSTLVWSSSGLIPSISGVTGMTWTPTTSATEFISCSNSSLSLGVMTTTVNSKSNFSSSISSTLGTDLIISEFFSSTWKTINALADFNRHPLSNSTWIWNTFISASKAFFMMLMSYSLNSTSSRSEPAAASSASSVLSFTFAGFPLGFFAVALAAFAGTPPFFNMSASAFTISLYSSLPSPPVEIMAFT